MNQEKDLTIIPGGGGITVPVAPEQYISQYDLPYTNPTPGELPLIGAGISI